MCGIFFISNNTITDNICKNFENGSGRGPEYSNIEQIDNNIFGFHRLAINGLDEISNQPFLIDECVLICNGEIYNYHELAQSIGVTLKTNSDCEIIIYLYRKFGIEYCLQLLDGVFAFVLYDKTSKKLIAARDPYGVRPMFYNLCNSGNIYIASEIKMIYNLVKNKTNIINFKPGRYLLMDLYDNTYNINSYRQFSFRNIDYNTDLTKLIELGKNVYQDIITYITNSIKKRIINTTERPVACLLSGGLDSSLIAALVNRYYLKHTGNPVETYSIGFKDSPDILAARKVANHINSIHTEVIVTEQDFLEAIPEVIYCIESYDTTTVRASVGNYLIAKYISKYSKAKVIFNGDGADELMGGYLYMKLAPDEMSFDMETRRLLNDIYMYDITRSDKSISSNGLEARTPFLDRQWVEFYLTIDRSLRYTTTRDYCEKYLIRKAFSLYDSELIPESILWRQKEAFSDGVSKYEKSWSTIIKEYLEKNMNINEEFTRVIKQSQMEYYHFNESKNKLMTIEQTYYRLIYNKYYKHTDNLIPYYWMPCFVEASDASARTLDIYNKDNK
tara:strand:+ start:2768 stop:4447 length:1680 start_codon:yes stop_codon:yes gene_type:complete